MKVLDKLSGETLDKIKKMQKGFEIIIDNDEWIKTDKKAEIVDIWHQIQKETYRRNADSYCQTFPFEEAETRGVNFWISGRSIQIISGLMKRLDELGIKYKKIGGSPL